jgi:hypothetical protein
MKKSEAKPGTKVLASTGYDEYGDGEHLAPYKYDEYGDTTLVGVIRTKEASPGHVWVKWIEGDFSDDEEEVDLKMLTLESERSQIEEEFGKVSKEIKEKMKEAAKLVNEAGKLAKKAHSELESMYDATRPLVDAMDNNGWRSSSWGC